MANWVCVPRMFAVLLSIGENIGFSSPVLFPLHVLKTFQFFPKVLVLSFEPFIFFQKYWSFLSNLHGGL